MRGTGEEEETREGLYMHMQRDATTTFFKFCIDIVSIILTQTWGMSHHCVEFSSLGSTKNDANLMKKKSFTKHDLHLEKKLGCNETKNHILY